MRYWYHFFPYLIIFSYIFQDTQIRHTRQVLCLKKFVAKNEWSTRWLFNYHAHISDKFVFLIITFWQYSISLQFMNCHIYTKRSSINNVDRFLGFFFDPLPLCPLCPILFTKWGLYSDMQTPPQCRPDLPGPGLLGQWGRMLLILVFVKFRTKQPLQYINWHKISKSATLKLSFFWFSKSKQKQTKWHF